MPITQTVHLQDFEPGHPSFGSSQYAHAHQIRVIPGGSDAFASEIQYGTAAEKVAPPARQGTQLMRALIKNGDSPPFGGTLRAEIQYPNVSVPSGGVIIWDGFSVYYPTNIEQLDSVRDGSSGEYRIGPQWHEAQGSPPFRLDTSTRLDGVVRVTRKVNGSTEAQRYTVATLAALQGKWVDYVVWAKWTRASDGWFVLWASIDGGPWTQVTPASWESGIKTCDEDGVVNYWKHGIYGSMGGLLYYDWAKRVIVDDTGDYFADVQTPGTPPSGGGSAPDPLPVDLDPVPVSVIARGEAATDVAASTLTIPSVLVEDGKSLVVEGMARIAAGATVAGITYGGVAMTVHQHEATDQTPSALGFIAELHGITTPVGDVVVTFSTNFETAAALASEVWDVIASVNGEWASGVGSSIDTAGIETTPFAAHLHGFVGVGGTISDAAPELGGFMARTGQRAGDTAEVNNNTTVNEAYGSQDSGSTREILARLPSSDRIWIAGSRIFPVQAAELSDDFKRYASLNWAIPLTV